MKKHHHDALTRDLNSRKQVKKDLTRFSNDSKVNVSENKHLTLLLKELNKTIKQQEKSIYIENLKN